MDISFKMEIGFTYYKELVLLPEEQSLYNKLDSYYWDISNKYSGIRKFGLYDNLKDAMNSYSKTLKYEIHRIGGYKRAKIKFYEIRAITDMNSFAFDRKINGKRIKVASALNLLSKLENVSSVEDLQFLRPLLLANNAGYKKTIFPPFYLGCRAMTVMSYKQD